MTRHQRQSFTVGSTTKIVQRPYRPAPHDSAHPVLLLEGHNACQIGHLPLHAVDALHHNQDLLPRPVYPRLPLCDRPPQHRLQMLHIVVRKHLRTSAAVRAACAGCEASHAALMPP